MMCRLGVRILAWFDRIYLVLVWVVESFDALSGKRLDFKVLGKGFRV